MANVEIEGRGAGPSAERLSREKCDDLQHEWEKKYEKNAHGFLPNAKLRRGGALAPTSTEVLC